MNALATSSLAAYWSVPAMSVNLVIFLNLLGALLLGLIVGYERAYHGRAAGMRTYGMVCMASAALTVFAGYPEHWFGGGHTLVNAISDPTRVIQGIVTGIGFLGAGVIMKDGLNISGLTTAASIWAASAIGVLVGVGFYAAAILLALLSASLMMWGGKLEAQLPSRPAIAVTMRFRGSMARPQADVLRKHAQTLGYQIAEGSFQVLYERGQFEWHFVAIATQGKRSASMTVLAEELAQVGGVETFSLNHARN